MEREEIKKFFKQCKETEAYFDLLVESEVGEIHHILPESIWPQFSKCGWNLVKISFENHYKVHELLPYMVAGQDFYKMLCAWNQMCGRSQGKYVTSEIYSKLKKDFSENNPSKLEHVKEIKRKKWEVYWADPKIREARTGANHPSFGRSISEEQKIKQSKTMNGRQSPLKGKERPNLKGKMAGDKNPMARSVVIDGVEYATLTEAAEKFGVTKQAIVYWIKTGRAIDKESGVKVEWKDSRTQAVVVKGLEFETMSDACKHFDVTMTTIRNWIKRGLANYKENKKLNFSTIIAKNVTTPLSHS